MKLMLQLSRANLPLAKAEALALSRARKTELIGSMLILETQKKGLERRLALTHKIYQFLFKATRKSLPKEMEAFDWQSIYKKNFCVRVFGAETRLERELAGFVWKKVKNPKVNLEKPVTAIHLYFIGNRVVCGLFLADCEKGFEERRAHLRPQFTPVSMHPRLARACVNLTGADMGDTIVDPFCGTGGILIEAGLMGIKAVGYDIDRRMIKMSMENLKHYGIKGYSLKQQDSLLNLEKCDLVVTDLPYGKNTGKMDLDRLYTRFLSILRKKLRKRAVIIFPYKVDPLIRKSGFRIEKKFTHYIHKSMTKRIYLLE